MRGFWPQQSGDVTGVTAHLNAIPKHVVTSTLTDLGWEGSTAVRGDVTDAVAALKAEPGGNLGITGSISLCHHLIRAGLVDEYRLLVYPVVIGAGRRLFEDGARQDLRLLETVAFGSGVTLVRYEPA